VLSRLQEHLEAIYGLNHAQRVQQFLIDEELARALGATGRAPEELLVHEAGQELWLGLYLSPELHERIETLGTTVETWLEGHLNAYCQLAEGVSHFLYLTYAALEGRTLSLLELETQAEVDKFAICLLQGWDRADRWGNEIHRRLFSTVSYNQALSEQERQRYEEANRVSGAYCRRLISLAAMHRMDRFLSELRFSYRLGAEAKLRYFAHTG